MLEVRNLLHETIDHNLLCYVQLQLFSTDSIATKTMIWSREPSLKYSHKTSAMTWHKGRLFVMGSQRLNLSRFVEKKNNRRTSTLFSNTNETKIEWLKQDALPPPEFCDSKQDTKCSIQHQGADSKHIRKHYLLLFRCD